MASTGMRVGAFKTLRKKHLKKLDDGNIAVGYLIKNWMMVILRLDIL
jgi:predicted Kef-type K+ transport protein